VRVLIKCCKSVNFKLRLCPKCHNPQVAVTKITRGLPVPRSLVKRVKGPKGEKRRQENELHIYDAYRADLQTQEEFTFEVKKWKAKWELYPTDQVKPIHLCGTLELVSKNLYPKIYCILKIELTMPSSTATAEITFSGLKRVLRGTVEEERSSALALLHTHRNIQLLWMQSLTSLIPPDKEK
jgi:hypothetical protein